MMISKSYPDGRLIGGLGYISGVITLKSYGRACGPRHTRSAAEFLQQRLCAGVPAARAGSRGNALYEAVSSVEYHK